MRDGLDSEHRKAGKDLGLDLDKKLQLQNHPVNGYCLRVTKAVNTLLVVNAIKSNWITQDAKSLTDKYTELNTNKGGVFFRTKALKQLAEDFAELSQTYSRTQSGLVKEVINIAGIWLLKISVSLFDQHKSSNLYSCSRNCRCDHCQPGCDHQANKLLEATALFTDDDCYSLAHVSVNAPTPYIKPKVAEKGCVDDVLSVSQSLIILKAPAI